MKNNILVSAIVSTYKSAKFIEGCLRDLVQQSLYMKGKLEIIIIDSASPENEGEIVKYFQAKYPNIIYERTPERITLYKAWNLAIKKARGLYITNANTDDRHRSDALEMMANYLNKQPDISLVYADQMITAIANETFATTKAKRHWDWPEYSYEEMKRACCVGSQPMWRKSLHNCYGYFREELACVGDYEFWLRIGSQGEQMMRIPKMLGLYYLNPQGLEHGTDGKTQLEHYQVCQEYAIPCASKPPSLNEAPQIPAIESLGKPLKKSESRNLNFPKTSLLRTLKMSAFGQALKLDILNRFW